MTALCLRGLAALRPLCWLAMALFLTASAVRADDMIVVAGGVMPDEDAVALKQMGVSEVLLQDTPLDKIVARLRELVAQRGAR